MGPQYFCGQNKYGVITPHKMEECDFGVLWIFDCDMSYLVTLHWILFQKYSPQGDNVVYPHWH